MPDKIQKLQYITQPVPGYSTGELVENICNAGSKWIQLRMKGLSGESFLKVAADVKQICDKYNATLIINDNVEVAKTIGAAGVHLGKNDMSIREAREFLGNTFIIGATINNVKELENPDLIYADYIGAGPFRFTSTKKELSPVIGLEGISEIANNTTLPVIAIGGIVATDCERIIQEKIYGVAVSSAITFAENRQETIKTFNNHLVAKTQLC